MGEVVLSSRFFRRNVKFPLVFFVLILSPTPGVLAQVSETSAAIDNATRPAGSEPAHTELPQDSGISPAASGPLGQGNFFERLWQFYARDWAGTLPAGPAPARRGVDAPLDSPPFPNGDWGYNASPTIGAPDGNVYPLMTALGHPNSRTRVYGWIDPSLNFSTSSTSNYPLAYAVFPDRLELSQAVVYVERLPNTVQNAHFDFGFA